MAGQSSLAVWLLGIVLAIGGLGLPLSAWAQDGLNEPPDGFKALFNGKDLSGWEGLVGNPKSRAKMSDEELSEAKTEANARARRHWEVRDGVLWFDGEGKSLVTAKDYADFEMYVDWKITEGGDSGIYLRGTPQVQIWDPSEQDGVGSGGLYNNQEHRSQPLVTADKAIGEWNTFRIKMLGRHVWVWLNGELVVPGVVMENYWEREKPIYPTGQIELQSHGSKLAFRNIYIRELVTAEDARRIEDAVPNEARVAPDSDRKVLIWTRAQGFYHDAIPYGARAVEAMGRHSGAFETKITDNLWDLLPSRLHDVDAIVLSNTTGDWTEPTDKDMARLPDFADRADVEVDPRLPKGALKAKVRQGLVDFMNGGAGLVGFHAATDALDDWEEFGRMIGGYYDGHPWHEEVGIQVEEPDHPLMEAFDGEDFAISDEIYTFRHPGSLDALRLLLSLDPERTDMAEVDNPDATYAVSWVKPYGDGRVFYSSLGHDRHIFWDKSMLRYYQDGIQFALGDLDVPHKAAGQGGDWTDLSDPEKWTSRSGWEFEGDTIALGEQGGGYLWTKEKYEDFVLDLEFKMSENCNSGVFFRTDPSNAVHGGFEVQILDSHGKEEVGEHDCGALYDIVGPDRNTTKDAGKWNHLKLRCDGPMITAWLNGVQTFQVDISRWTEAGKNPDGTGNKFQNALAELPHNNHIGFQDHGHPVWYRNVRIKRLD